MMRIRLPSFGRLVWFAVIACVSITAAALVIHEDEELNILSVLWFVTKILLWVSLPLLLVVGISKLLPGPKKKEMAEKKPIAEHHPEPEKPHTGEHKKHDHKEKPGGLLGLLIALVQLAAILVVALIIALVGNKIGKAVSPVPQLSSWNNSYVYSAPKVPDAACSKRPDTVKEFTAPTSGCSEQIEVPTGTYVCTDPGPASGRIRVKSWYGSIEPDTWNTGGTGDKQCFGATGSEPLTVHAWVEPLR